MQKINFQDLPNTTTPIDANNLNLLQDNIENDIGDLSELETTEKTDLVSAINEANQHGSGGGGETLPVGAEIEFDGQSTDIPTGWEEITNPDSYSTTEIKTNKTWIDGKPIYRKVFVVTLNNQTMNITHNITNFGIILIDESMSEYRKGNTFIPLNYYYTTSDYSRVIVEDTQIQIRNKLTGTISDWTAYITLEYTKTTD